MATIQVTGVDGQQQEVALTEGLSLMEVLRDAGYDEIMALCGGCCSCATCHVHIEHTPTALPEMEDSESMLLEMTDAYDADKSRLSCQIPLSPEHDGLRVAVVAED